MTWPAPDPYKANPCPFIRAWIGPCGQTNRYECRHSRVWPMGKQLNHRCVCARPALAECENASSLVCGAPICHVGYCTYHGGHCR